MDNKNKLFLRKLVSKSFCSEISDDFEKYRGTKLSNIFDLYYDKIHKISIGTFYLSYFFVFFYPILLFFKIFNKTKKITPLKNCLILVFAFFILLLDAAKLILSAILFYFMEKGNLEKYNAFLDCKNVRVKFFKKISDINRLRGYFYAFVILNIISLGIERIEKSIDFGGRIVDEINKMNKIDKTDKTDKKESSTTNF